MIKSKIPRKIARNRKIIFFADKAEIPLSHKKAKRIMVRIRMVWKIKKNSLQTPVVVISSLKIARLLIPPEKMFLKLAASVGPSLLNQKARTTKHNEKNRKKILWMV